MLGTIKGLRGHPGLEAGTGASTYLPSLRGTDRYGFETLLSQAQGQTFLQAYQDLKGGGQITEIEGQKAENAIARLQQGLKKEEFLQALSELEEVVNKGLQRAKQKAGINSAPSQGKGKKYTLPDGRQISHEDIVFTARKRGMTVKQVKDAAGIR